MKPAPAIASTVTWRIRSIDLVSFKAEEKVKTPGKYDPNKITFYLSVHYDLVVEERLIRITFPIEIFSDETHTEQLGSIQTKGEFDILNFEEVMKENDGQFPVNLISVLVGVTLSTTRGMLILLSKGTSFEKAIIPIINPMVFFNQKAIEPGKVIPGPTS
jgi:hypothetical protein